MGGGVVSHQTSHPHLKFGVDNPACHSLLKKNQLITQNFNHFIIYIT
jgi:hypothetical protein